MQQQANLGWEGAMTLHDYHFGPETNRLNSAGQLHLRWMLTQAPAQYRSAFVSRGMNTPEQIEERLANAARVAAYRPLYDYVVTNEEGTLGQAEQFLRELILRRTP